MELKLIKKCYRLEIIDKKNISKKIVEELNYKTGFHEFIFFNYSKRNKIIQKLIKDEYIINGGETQVGLIYKAFKEIKLISKTELINIEAKMIMEKLSQ